MESILWIVYIIIGVIIFPLAATFIAKKMAYNSNKPEGPDIAFGVIAGLFISAFWIVVVALLLLSIPFRWIWKNTYPKLSTVVDWIEEKFNI